jgi:hypothetical protein
MSSIEAAATPELSVVVTVVEGGAALPRFLTALLQQDGAPSMEILVPLDATVGDLLPLQRDFPTVRFLDLGAVETARPSDSASGQHELYDRRRSAALRAATGGVVAILEDRGIPRADWAATAMRLHREHDYAVIGGAIEPAPSRLTDWALYVCDYSRYALPLPGAATDWVSDVNVTYKRRALESTRTIWSDRFHEPAVHWDLLKRGEVLFLSPDLRVDHHRLSKPLGRLVTERFHWGRLFGYIRGRHSSTGKRLVQLAASPVVPFVVLLRHARVHFRRGDGLRFVAALPVLLLFLFAWTLGEAIGTLTLEP